MFGSVKIDGNERIIAQQYVNKIGGDSQSQQVLKALLDDAAEELQQCEQACETLKIEKEALESEHQGLQEKYDQLLQKWEAMGGDLI